MTTTRDGNTNGHWGRRSCTHSKNEQNPWWQVDLQSTKTVQAVAVYNRADCCGSRCDSLRVHVDLISVVCRLAGFEVRVGDQAVWSSNPKCGDKHNVGQETPITVDCGGLQGNRSMDKFMNLCLFASGRKTAQLSKCAFQFIHIYFWIPALPATPHTLLPQIS